MNELSKTSVSSHFLHSKYCSRLACHNYTRDIKVVGETTAHAEQKNVRKV